MKPYHQGYFDGLCGPYSIANALRIVAGATDEECQDLFHDIVAYLPKRTIKDGVMHAQVKRVMKRFIQDIRYETDKKSLGNIDEWWEYTREFLSTPGRAVILSVIDPKRWGKPTGHLTVTNRMTRNTIYLHDTSGLILWRRADCVTEYEDGKIVIYPAQCWYLEKAIT